MDDCSRYEWPAAAAQEEYPDGRITLVELFHAVRTLCLREFARVPPTLEEARRYLDHVLLARRLPLLVAARAGSRKAWTEIAGELTSVVGRMSTRGIAREDLISDSFLILRERAMATYDVTRPFGAFLHGIARNVMRRRNVRSALLTLPEALPSPVVPPPQEAWRRECSAYLAKALEQLEEFERRLLSKRVIEGKRLRIIANEEGLKNPQEAQRRFLSAVRSLRRAYLSQFSSTRSANELSLGSV